ncbi:MAG TPA: DUF3105 domain-containing protein [Solirubrobacteraceae bacterium]|nr:DUF3105 domain-containing protein [Solirubrobacteraceae bacterium]
MSHRQEEKQKRREERLAREAAEQAAAARRQRMTLAGAVLAGVAVIAVVVLLVSGTLGGGDDGESAAQDVPSSEELADQNITLPEQQIGDLKAAAEAAGCKLENPPIEGRNHETKDFTAADYKTNPPTSGNHFPQWYDDGIYAAGDTPNLGMTVHTLEHGRIDVQYKPGTPTHTIKQLEALLAEQEDGYHMLLFQNGTNMDAQIAATAWGHSLTCPQFNNKVFDALRTFRAKYIDQGPEDVP